MLVRNGGSRKQSLIRLGIFIYCLLNLFTISSERSHKESDLKKDIRNVYKFVIKMPLTFLFTDSYVAEKGFLKLINNILTIVMVLALFPKKIKNRLVQPLDEEMRMKKHP